MIKQTEQQTIKEKDSYIIDYDIKKFIEFDYQKPEYDVNVGENFALSFITADNKQITLYFDYDCLLDIMTKLQPYEND